MKFFSHDARSFHKSVCARPLIVLLLLLLCIGCSVPTSRRRVIPEGIAGDPEHLLTKLELLKPGMNFRQAFDVLEIKPKTPGVREIVTAEEKQRILYGAAQLVGSPEELEQFRQRLSKHRIWEIKLIDIEKDLTFDSPVSVVTMQAGPNFVSYLVFFEDKLIGPPNRPENFYEKETTRIYISDLFGSLFNSGVGRGLGQLAP